MAGADVTAKELVSILETHEMRLEAESRDVKRQISDRLAQITEYRAANNQGMIDFTKVQVGPRTQHLDRLAGELKAVRSMLAGAKSLPPNYRFKLNARENA